MILREVVFIMSWSLCGLLFCLRSFHAERLLIIDRLCSGTLRLTWQWRLSRSNSLCTHQTNVSSFPTSHFTRYRTVCLSSSCLDRSDWKKDPCSYERLFVSRLLRTPESRWLRLWSFSSSVDRFRANGSQWRFSTNSPVSPWCCSSYLQPATGGITPAGNAARCQCPSSVNPEFSQCWRSRNVVVSLFRNDTARYALDILAILMVVPKVHLVLADTVEVVDESRSPVATVGQ